MRPEGAKVDSHDAVHHDVDARNAQIGEGLDELLLERLAVIGPDDDLLPGKPGVFRQEFEFV